MALTAQKAANWTAQQRAWLRANDPNKLKLGNQLVQKAGLKAKVTKAQVDAAGKPKSATGGSSTPQYSNPTGGAKGKPMTTIASGKVPTLQEFTTKGKWYLPNDPGAKDYGRSLGSGDAKYYGNFVKTLEGAKNDAERRAILRSHGFDYEQKKAEAPKRSSGGGGSALTPPPAPPLKSPRDPIEQEERDEISDPGDGLENTIKTTPKLLRERRRRSYLTAG